MSAQGHDVLSLNEDPRLARLRDEQILALGVEEDRIVVTADVSDFVPILRRWASSRRAHCGVILVYLAHHEFALIVRGVERLLEQRQVQDDWLNVAVSLDRSTA